MNVSLEHAVDKSIEYMTLVPPKRYRVSYEFIGSKCTIRVDIAAMDQCGEMLSELAFENFVGFMERLFGCKYVGIPESKKEEFGGLDYKNILAQSCNFDTFARLYFEIP